MSGLRASAVFFVYFMSILFLTLVPHVFSFSNDIFVNDFYAKRILAVLFVPVLAVYLFFILKDMRLPVFISQSFTLLYLFLFVLSSSLALLSSNGLVNYATDVFLFVSVPVYLFFVSKLSASRLNLLLFFSVVVGFISGVLGVKHQISYLGTVSCVFILFYPFYVKKFKLVYLFVLPFVLYSLYETMIGKSAVIVFFIAVLVNSYVVFGFKRMFLSLAVFVSVVTILLSFSFVKESLESTPAYKKSISFSLSSDVGESDVSTGHRIFELYSVFERLEVGSGANRWLGYGFGAGLDLTDTEDSSVISANGTAKDVRVVHLLFGFFLLKFGYLGALLYSISLVCFLTVGFRILRVSRVVGESRGRLLIGFSVSYFFAIVWDGQVSSGHMLANPLFWVVFSYFILRGKNGVKYVGC